MTLCQVVRDRGNDCKKEDNVYEGAEGEEVSGLSELPRESVGDVADG